MSDFKRDELEPINLRDFLINRGYDNEQIEGLLEKDILILPSIHDTPVTDESGRYELLDPETIKFKKIIAQKIDAELITDQKLEHRYVEHLSANIILPVLIILTPIVWDIIKDIIANLLYDKIKGLSKGGKKPSARFEFEIQEGIMKKRKRIVYEGPAEELAEILKESRNY